MGKTIFYYVVLDWAVQNHEESSAKEQISKKPCENDRQCSAAIPTGKTKCPLKSWYNEAVLLPLCFSSLFISFFPIFRFCVHLFYFSSHVIALNDRSLCSSAFFDMFSKFYTWKEVVVILPITPQMDIFCQIREACHQIFIGNWLKIIGGPLQYPWKSSEGFPWISVGFGLCPP